MIPRADPHYFGKKTPNIRHVAQPKHHVARSRAPPPADHPRAARARNGVFRVLTSPTLQKLFFHRRVRAQRLQSLGVARAWPQVARIPTYTPIGPPGSVTISHAIVIVVMHDRVQLLA